MSFFDRLKLKTQSTPEPQESGVDRLGRLATLVANRPADWSVRNDLADALAQAGRIDEAVGHLCAIGEQLATQGFLAKAQALYKKVVRLQPRNQAAAERLAELTTARINESASRTPALKLQPVTASAAEDDVSAPEAPVMPDEEVSSVGVPLSAAADATSETAESFDTAETFETVEAVEVAETAEAVEVAEVHPVAAAGEWTPQIELTSQVEVPPQSETVMGREPEPVAASVAAEEVSSPAVEPSTIEEWLAAAEQEEWKGALDRALEVLRNCARAYPDRIEPVARLVDIAERAGVEDVLAQAQARLCDLQWRSGDCQNARVTAEALVNRFPDDPKHRARLDFIVSELPDSMEQLSTPADAEVSEDGWSAVNTESDEPIADSPIEIDADSAIEIHADGPNEIHVDSHIDVQVDSHIDVHVDVQVDVQAAEAEPVAEADSAAAAVEEEETREELERAASDPSQRFVAARKLAHRDMAAGELVSALSWLEWAAGGMPTAEQEEDLAYDMATVLELAGEFDRALGVYQEIAAKVGPGYRDVSERISRLSVHAQ